MNLGLSLLPWSLLILASFAIMNAAEGASADEKLSATHLTLYRVFEACRTRMLQTGKWPADLREISSLISTSFRNQIPDSLEFHDPASPEGAAIRRSSLAGRAPYLRLPLPDGRWLNVADSGWIYESRRFWESEFVELMPCPYADFHLLMKDARPIPQRALPRSPRCGSAQLDLVPFCNAIPTTPWFFGPQIKQFPAPKFGGWLPDGVFEHHNLLFDVRGVLQIEGQLAPEGSSKRYRHSYPNDILNISIGQSCRGFHVLAGTVYDAPAGAVVATLRLHFATGVKELPLCYGEHLAAPGDTASSSECLYPVQRQAEQLYSLHYFYLVNPHPGDLILRIDFSSGMTPSHPYLLAITLDP